MTHSPAYSSLLDVSLDLITAPLPKGPTTTTLDFDGLLEPPLRLHEDLKEGCGGQLWPAGMILAKYLLRCKRKELYGRTIIELGSGGGLVGLAVALAFPSTTPRLCLTDQAPMLPLLQRNISLNSLDRLVDHATLNWGDPLPEHLQATKPDIVLAADCVYFEPAFPLLLKSLEDLMGNNTICYFCFKKRRRADMNFVKNLKKQFDVKSIEDDPDKERWGREAIFLYEVRKRYKLSYGCANN